jgi:hypothetical protein
MQTSWSYQATLHTNDTYRKGQKLTVAYTLLVFIPSKYYYLLLIPGSDESTIMSFFQLSGLLKETKMCSKLSVFVTKIKAEPILKIG